MMEPIQHYVLAYIHGRPSPQRQRCISLCFRFPLLFENFFQTPWKISPIFFAFHPTQNLEFASIFAQTVHFPLFCENYYFPSYFFKFLL